MKTRIVERILVNGRKKYVIQKRHWLFFWMWVDASKSSYEYGMLKERYYGYYDELEQAKANLCHFDGSKPRNKVVYP